MPVEYRADDIVVMRRNPYYWKVDEAGNQLPYLDEMHYKLSTWADRDVQAVAGTGDFSNLEQAESYVEALKRSADPNAPARLAFGARTIGYSLYMNMSANGWGEPDERAQAVRELNRNLDFRLAVTSAIDREQLGRVAGQGSVHHASIRAASMPTPRSTTRSRRSTIRSISTPPRRCSTARAWPTPTATASSTSRPAPPAVQTSITLLANSDYSTDKNLAEGVIASMERLGIRVIANFRSPAPHVTTTAGTAASSTGRSAAPGLGTDLGGAEHRRRSLRSVRGPPFPPRRHRRHGRPPALRAGTGRHRQRLHRRPDDAAKRAELMKTVPEALHRERLLRSV